MEDVYRLYKSMKIIHNYINGKLSKPKNSNYIKVFNPSTGKVVASKLKVNLPIEDELYISNGVKIIIFARMLSLLQIVQE